MAVENLMFRFVEQVVIADVDQDEPTEFYRYGFELRASGVVKDVVVEWDFDDVAEQDGLSGEKQVGFLDEGEGMVLTFFASDPTAGVAATIRVIAEGDEVITHDGRIQSRDCYTLPELDLSE